MRTYVCTFGYDSRRVTRPVISNGLDSNDRLVLVRPTTDDEDNQSNEGLAEIRQTTRQIDSGIDVETVGLPAADFTAAVRGARDALADADGDLVVVFGGGPREIFLPFAVATLTHRESVTKTLQYADTDGVVREPCLPDLITPIPEAARPTLELVAELGGETTLPDLAAASESSKSTVGRHLDELEVAGAVGTSTETQTRLVELTLAGELRLR